MTPNLLYVLTVGVLFGAGVSLLLERSLTRVTMGVIMLGNGANLLILMASTAGAAPIVGRDTGEPMADPLPQAMILTAIVITLGMTAFLLALAYRTWQLLGHDEVQDDAEDRRIMERAEHDQGPDASDSAGVDEPEASTGVAAGTGDDAGRRRP